MRDSKVRLVSNVPRLPKSRKETISDLAKQRREANFLVSEIRHLKEQVRFDHQVICEAVDILESGMDYGDWPTMGELLRLITRLKFAVEGK